MNKKLNLISLGVQNLVDSEILLEDENTDVDIIDDPQKADIKKKHLRFS